MTQSGKLNVLHVFDENDGSQPAGNLVRDAAGNLYGAAMSCGNLAGAAYEEPFRTLALVCVCFGLRASECLALKWSDVDWLDGKLRVERGIVRQQVGEVKTIYSGRLMAVDAEMLEVLKAWKQTTQFSADEDWIFASPVQLGALPWSYPWLWRVFQKAATAAQIGKLATHTMRHTYRSWLDAVGTGIAVQQKLMRHSDIRTTLNVYGDVITDEMAQAHTKVVGLALRSLGRPSKYAVPPPGVTQLELSLSA